MSPLAKFQRFLISVLIAVSFFFGGFYYGKKGYDVEIKKNPPQITIINKTPLSQEVDFAQFWEVWEIVRENYLMRPVDGQKMVYGAIEGMVKSLGDPYTSYLAPATNEVFSSNLNNKYEGIGAELGIREEQLIVVSPLDGSPAKQAGIRAGDKIYKIDGESTFGITVTEAVQRIRGDSGKIVTLTVLHKDETETKDIPITRGVIKMDSVTWEDKNDGTAYIHISRFGDDTNAQWDKVVKEINVKMEELDVIILDMRGNPGGYLQSAVHIAGEFFKGKPVLYQEDATKKPTSYDTDRNGIFVKIPKVYILLDEGSASASEILAGALKFRIQAEIVGAKSFGKGTIQDARDFKDGSSVHITTSKWLTPDKIWVHDVGISPDYAVERTADDYNNSRDPQLDKAIELAKEI